MAAFKYQFNVLQLSEQDTQDGTPVFILASPTSQWNFTYTADAITDALNDFNNDFPAAIEANPPVVGSE